MVTRTIQLKDDTYARLRMYKVGGMTFDEVVRRLMENSAVERFHEDYREWQRRVLKNMERSGEFTEL
ncbi:MAG: antitoxin VapB family protein [Euryarchaeota archaeon]|nr:antitoxin VapB family protein [Euryarchaeota archaeon]